MTRPGPTTSERVEQAVADLPAALRLMRASRGRSLRQVALETGLSFSTVQRAEQDPGRDLGISVGSLLQLLRWLEAPPVLDPEDEA